MLFRSHGGGHEDGLRSSTENIPGIAGFAKAAEIAMYEMDSDSEKTMKLRDRLMEFLTEKFEGVYFNGHESNRLPGHLSFSIHGLEGESIRVLLMLDELGIAVSTGSACSSNDKSHHSSHVLKAIGLNPFEARGAIRVTFGRYSTATELNYFMQSLQNVMGSLTSIFSYSNNTPS